MFRYIDAESLSELLIITAPITEDALSSALQVLETKGISLLSAMRLLVGSN